MIRALRFPFRTPPPVDEVSNDLNDEFNLHLELIAQEYISQGATPDEAMRHAAQRFGDIPRLHRECIAISQGNITMLQKTLIVLVAAFLLTTIASVLVGINMYQRAEAAREVALAEHEVARMAEQEARASTDFLAQLLQSVDPAARNEVDAATILEQAHARLDAQNFDPAVEAQLRQTIDDALARINAEQAAAASATGTVYVAGFIERPGVYALPAAGNELDIARLLTAAGGFPEDKRCNITVKRINGVGRTIIFDQTIDHIADLAANDLTLRADDLIIIKPAE